MPVPLLKFCPPVEALTADSDLLARFSAARDEGAFAELIRRHGPVVYRVCRRLVPAHAEDAFQAVFLILACRGAAIRNPAAVGSWLVGVAGRVAGQMRKAEHRRAGYERRAGCDRSPTAPPDTGELAAVLDDELARLPDELRDPVVLCLVAGRTHAQAAADLGASVRTLRRRLDRARAALRARLEGRGVVPTVATALVAGTAEATGAVSPALARQTVSVVFQFLDGTAPPTAVGAVAKGVMRGMVKFKASTLVATAAAVLVCLGVGAARQDAPRPPAGPDETAPKLDRPVPNVVTAGPGARPESVHRSANFVVSAPTPVMARVIASEAEHHRRVLALKWLGKELPQWPRPCEIRFIPGSGASGGATTFTYAKDKDGAPVMKSAGMEIRGDFLAALTDNLPHEVMHTVLASYFGRPLPRWADEGIAMLSEGDAEQFAHDVRVRELLNAGRGVRLKVLLTMTEYPKDVIVLYSQGHSLARFLAGRSAPGAPGLENLPHVGPLFKNPGADGHRRLIAFIQLGTEKNTAESWGVAAKTVYGFDSVDALEEEWLASLKTPPKKAGANGVPPPARPAPTDRIPPLKLPIGPDPVEVPFGQDIGTKR
jgi:RNA polymerase sigma factor (sigma-70 family)